MKFRIIGWAVAGFLIAISWALYCSATFPELLTGKPTVWALAQFTCPIAFASIHFHFPLGMYWAFVGNAATYALIGLTVETLRQTLQPAT